MAWPVTNIITTDMDAGTDNPANARAQIKQMADNINAMISALNAALGVCGLDAGGLVETVRLPTIPANKGGTGQTSFTIGDIFYANSASTLAKLGAGAAGLVLTSGGAGVAPSWAAAGGGFASGTRMSFNQTTAPTGWTKDTTAALNDSIMRIVTGTVASGGSLAFGTWAAQTSVGATTLSESQLPAHKHYGSNGSGSYSPQTYALTYATALANTTVTPQAGGNGPPAFTTYPITHPVGSGGSHTHSLSQNIKYNDFIICSKD